MGFVNPQTRACKQQLIWGDEGRVRRAMKRGDEEKKETELGDWGSGNRCLGSTQLRP